MGEKASSKKIIIGISALIVLSLAVCAVSFALVWAEVSVNNSLFQTGNIKINLNDGMPVIEEHELVFEPGMTVRKDFFIENQSTWDVYYKLYLEDIDGDLADVLQITVNDGERVLYSGKANDLTRANVGAADDVLKLNERRELSICFYFPEEAGDDAQNKVFTFSLSADAVQTKNNPNRLFN